MIFKLSFGALTVGLLILTLSSKRCFIVDRNTNKWKNQCNGKATLDQKIEEDIPYQCPGDLIVPDQIELPDTERQAAKIEKTAAFIANNGIQMEILVKAKQSKNDQFQFLNCDHKLNPFYKFLLEKIKNAEYIPARRHLFHLTKKEKDDNTMPDSVKSLSKIDITNTAYFKLINKYRSDAAPVTTETAQNERTLDSNSDNIITEENSAVTTKVNDEEKEKLYTTLYEQYYTYYYNYYYQLHNSTALSNDSNHIRIEEDSKSLAINAAVYAAKAGVEQYEKEHDEKLRLAEQKIAKADKKKQHCMIIRYVHYVIKYGNDFEYSMMKNSEKLKFLDPENENHSFYQQCLRKAKKASSKCEETVEEQVVDESSMFPKWEDYVKKPLSGGGIKCAPKLLADHHKSCITPSQEEQTLVEVGELIALLLNAEKIGRDISTPQVVDLKATRKRKATEFMEKIKNKAAQSSDSDTEERRRRSKKSSSKRRKHRHR